MQLTMDAAYSWATNRLHFEVLRPERLVVRHAGHDMTTVRTRRDRFNARRQRPTNGAMTTR